MIIISAHPSPLPIIEYPKLFCNSKCSCCLGKKVKKNEKKGYTFSKHKETLKHQLLLQRNGRVSVQFSGRIFWKEKNWLQKNQAVNEQILMLNIALKKVGRMMAGVCNTLPLCTDIYFKVIKCNWRRVLCPFFSPSSLSVFFFTSSAAFIPFQRTYWIRYLSLSGTKRTRKKAAQIPLK